MAKIQMTDETKDVFIYLYIIIDRKKIFRKPKLLFQHIKLIKKGVSSYSKPFIA